MKDLYIKDIKVGDIINDMQLMVEAYEPSQDKNKSGYIKLVLRDKDGKVDGMIWSNYLDFCSVCKTGDIVRVTAEVKEFNKKAQLTIKRLIIDKEYELTDFIAAADRPVETIMKDIETYIDRIENKHMKEFLIHMFEDQELRNKFTHFPAGKHVHHAYTGGLAEHVLDMLQMSDVLLMNHPLANRDIVYIGIILHDIGKLQELGEEAEYVFDYTLTGTMLGHIFIGALWFNQHIPADFPEDLRVRITHVILSHHGKLELGSPVIPKTYEAVIVNKLDEASSLLNAVSMPYKNYTGVSEYSEKLLPLNNNTLYLRPYVE